MVHFATFFSQECLWQSGMCRDFGIWFMIWYKTDGLDLHLMYGNFSQAIEWLRQYEIWGQIISSTILANWFTDHWFKCLHGFITGLWLLYEALNVISFVLSSKVSWWITKGSELGQCQPRALFPIDEVVDDILDTDEGARDEAKEANKEESSIFGSSDSKTNYLRPSFLFQRKIHFIAFNTINFYCHKMVAM